MGRVLSLFGMMVFTAGVFALASLAKAAPQQQPRLLEDDTPRRSQRPRLLDVPALSYHARFSVN